MYRNHGMYNIEMLNEKQRSTINTCKTVVICTLKKRQKHWPRNFSLSYKELDDIQCRIRLVGPYIAFIVTQWYIV